MVVYYRPPQARNFRVLLVVECGLAHILPLLVCGAEINLGVATPTPLLRRSLVLWYMYIFAAQPRPFKLRRTNLRLDSFRTHSMAGRTP